MAAKNIVGFVQGLGPGEISLGAGQHRRGLDGLEPQGQAPQVGSQRHLGPEGFVEVVQPALQGDQGQGFPGGAAGLELTLALTLPELLRQPLVRHHHQGAGAGFLQ